MRMCYNAVRDIPFAFNAIFSFLFAFYSIVAFADERLPSDSIVPPLIADDVVQALLLSFELENEAGSGETKRNAASRISSSTNDGCKTVRKRDQSASNTAWFGPRLGRRRKRSLLTNDVVGEDDDSNNNNVFFEDTDNSSSSSKNDVDNEDNIVVLVVEKDTVEDDGAEKDEDDDDNNSNKKSAILKILRDRNRGSRENNNDNDDDNEVHRVHVIRPYPFTFPVDLDGYVSKRQGGMKPRLGRRGGSGSGGRDGSLAGAASTAVENTWDESEKTLKAPPFSPRLGRRSSSMPLKPRLGRAESAIFKPRLGRGPLSASTLYRKDDYVHSYNHEHSNDDEDDDFGRHNHDQAQAPAHGRTRTSQLHLNNKNH